MTRSSARRGRRGFTLIEILVVVAIIALLVAILPPSLRQAREQGRAVQCGAQLKQIYSGLFMYTSDHREILPYFGWLNARPGGEQGTWPWWVSQTARYLANEWALYKCPSDKNPYQIAVRLVNGRARMAGSGRANPAELSAFTVDVTYRSSCDLLVHQTWQVKDAHGRDTTLSCPFPRKTTSFVRPATTLLLIEADVRPHPTIRECFRAITDLAGATSNPQQEHLATWSRHNGRANFLFLDGHVGRYRPESAARELAPKQEFIDNSANRRFR